MKITSKPLNELKELEKKFDARNKLWENLNVFEDNRKKWMLNNFKEVNVEEVKTLV